jgi:hypothetical protein
MGYAGQIQSHFDPGKRRHQCQFVAFPEMADAKDLEVLVFGVAGTILMALDFPISPVLLGYVLGPLIEENFRRALEISGGDFLTFIERPISATVLAITLLLVLAQLFFGCVPCAVPFRSARPVKFRRDLRWRQGLLSCFAGRVAPESCA